MIATWKEREKFCCSFKFRKLLYVSENMYACPVDRTEID